MVNSSICCRSRNCTKVCGKFVNNSICCRWKIAFVFVVFLNSPNDQMRILCRDKSWSFLLYKILSCRFLDVIISTIYVGWNCQWSRWNIDLFSLNNVVDSLGALGSPPYFLVLELFLVPQTLSVSNKFFVSLSLLYFLGRLLPVWNPFNFRISISCRSLQSLPICALSLCPLEPYFWTFMISCWFVQ